MTEPRSMKDWEVEESSDPENQWQLLETEQELPSDLTLEETETAQQDWRPVDHVEPQKSGGRNWILPSFIILAMVAVVAYIAWLGLNGPGFLPPSSPTEDTAPEVVDPAAVVMDTPAVEEPTATVEPEPTATTIPTLEPSPTPALVEKLFGIIESEYGLNIRANPSADAEVIRLAENAEKFGVIQEVDGWLEVELEDGTSGWVSANFVNVIPEMVPALPGEAVPLAEAPAEPTAVAETPSDEQPEVAADPAVQPTPVELIEPTPPEPFTNVVPAGPAILVLAEGGVNARTSDTTDSDIILTLPQGAALSAIGQNAAGDWLQTELPSGDKAWVSATPVETRGEIETLPVVDPNAAETASEPTDSVLPDPTAVPAAEPVAESAPITSTAPATSTVSLTTTVAVTETLPVEELLGEIAAELTVGLIGVKARTSPSLAGEVAEMLGSGTVLPVTGRTADNTWVAVTLTNGDVVWVFAGTVDLSVDPATLPVVEP